MACSIYETWHLATQLVKTFRKTELKTFLMLVMTVGSDNIAYSLNKQIYNLTVD